MPVLALAGGILSFASPKESIQRKGDPDAAYFLRFSHLSAFARMHIPVLLAKCGIPAATLRAIPDKCSDARRGIREMVFTMLDKMKCINRERYGESMFVK